METTVALDVGHLLIKEHISKLFIIRSVWKHVAIQKISLALFSGYFLDIFNDLTPSNFSYDGAN